MTNDTDAGPSKSPFERFQLGDSVEHIALGSGVVTGNDGQTITVTYNGADKITRGFYNDTFFKSNPHSLIHK